LPPAAAGGFAGRYVVIRICTRVTTLIKQKPWLIPKQPRINGLPPSIGAEDTIDETEVVPVGYPDEVHIPLFHYIELFPRRNPEPISLKDRLSDAAPSVYGGDKVIGVGLNGVDTMVGWCNMKLELFPGSDLRCIFEVRMDRVVSCAPSSDSGEKVPRHPKPYCELPR
jgi:hypothetical protein